MNIEKKTIEIGIEKPFRILHITDAHVCLAYEDEKARDKDFAEMAISRYHAFGDEKPKEYYEELIAYAKDENIPVLLTGDIYDFMSRANLEYLRDSIKDIDSFYVAGNHDFCHFVGRAKEDYAYKLASLKRIAPYIKQNLFFDSRIINGVNFVALDDTYYLISDGQTKMLRAEAAKGYPIILCMHVPLYTPESAKKEMEIHPCAYMTGAPEELLKIYEEYRRFQQTPDEATKRAIEYINNEPMIKALITGHNHRTFDEALPSGKMQYMTDGSYHGGAAREFLII